MDNANNDNQIDGIKKMSTGKMKKSRDLVLSSIGETAKKEKPLIDRRSQVAKGPKMDAISPQKIQKAPEETKPLIKKRKAKAKKIVSLVNEETKTEKKKEVNPPTIEEPEKKEKQDKEKVKTEKKKLLDSKKEEKAKLKKKREAEQKKEKEAKLKEKKRQEKEKLDIAKKRKEKRAKAIQDFRANIKTSIKTALIYVFFVFSLTLFSYLILAFVVLYFGKSSDMISSISKVIPVPAIVSEEGVLNFYEYKNYYQKLLADKSKIEASDVVRLFKLNDLYKKHGVSSREELVKILPYDKDVNIAPYNRIQKIYKSIEAEGDFVKVARKFGDVEKLTLNKTNLGDFDFGEKIVDLKKGETSEIITTAKGYYIIHCFDIVKNDMSLSYVYIPLTSLDEYLDSQTKDYKFWNLTNF